MPGGKSQSGPKNRNGAISNHGVQGSLTATLVKRLVDKFPNLLEQVEAGSL
jgi:hypothetical protein